MIYIVLMLYKYVTPQHTFCVILPPTYISFTTVTDMWHCYSMILQYDGAHRLIYGLAQHLEQHP